MNLAQFTFRLFDDQEWYKERMTQCKFVITASVGIFVLLVLSPEKLPDGAADRHWWLYRVSTVATGIAAIGATCYYLLCFRLRFLARFMDGIENDKPVSKLVRIYLQLIPFRRVLEVTGYWIAYSMMVVGFFSAMLFGSTFIILAVWPQP